jgi:hypothetical protein
VNVNTRILLTMKVESYIYEKLKFYSQFRSQSHGESAFIEVLRNDFLGCGDWYSVSKNGVTEYAVLVDKGFTNPYLFCVHTDRVLIKGQSVTNTIWRDEEFVCGQLDNILGIAIVRCLVYLGCPISIIFTTKEEESRSAEQILQALKLLETDVVKLKLISIDLDVFRTVEEFSKGELTIRDADGVGFMDLDLVSKLRNTAHMNGIKYIGNEKGRTISEAGLVYSYSDGKVSGAHVGIPITNYHSLEERARWTSINNVVSLFCNRFLAIEF